MNKLILLLALNLGSFSCSTSNSTDTPMVSSTDSVGKSAVEIAATAPVTEPSDSLHNLQARKDLKNLPDTAFVDMIRYAEGFGYDMRYATANNFLDTAVYPCPTCKLRKEVADALVRANTSLQKQGVRIKFFDCYRPLDVQKQMWAVMPDGRYVANPYKSGSIHNRGAAVDISLETLAGKELDMGTGFDHFGKEAHHTYTQLPDTVLANRKLLKSEMEQAGFSALATEWWHYLYGSKSRYTLANESLCE